MAQRSQPSLTQPGSTADKAAALKLTPVSRETELRLDRYVDLLLEWQAKTNLVAPSTLPHLWTRHISDSLQLLTLAPLAKIWVDLGSGGGFPGVVLACALAETSCARHCALRRHPGWCIWPKSRIVWIESPARSIA